MKEEFLFFNMLGVPYGVRLARIREIITYGENITALPNTPRWVLGVINLRGEIVPVIDFRLKFSEIAQLYDEETIIIALKLEEDRMVAIAVDSVEQTAFVDASDQETPADISTSIPLKAIEGFVRIDQEMITLLDIDQLLSLDEI